MNRQHDLRTSQSSCSGTELDLVHRQDIERMCALKSWKGVRHALGLKVNGQRTRCTGDMVWSWVFKKEKVIGGK